MTSPNEEDANVWPDKLLHPSAARAWIASALPGAGQVLGPIQILQAKHWGVTASFAVTGEASADGRAQHGREVIFKAAARGMFPAAPQVAEALARCVPGAVPELLAWERRDDLTFTLFAPFEGQPVSALGELPPLLEVARTLAGIQSAFATLPSSETQELPRMLLSHLPELHDLLIRDVRDRHLACWHGEGSEMAEQFALPLDDLLPRLEAVRPLVARWTEELAAGGWPDTIDHVDLHWDNAVVRPDGRMLIFDWEEAVISCPFFSLDRLLNDARELDLGEAAAWAAPPAGTPLYTPSERALRDAYLDALPWGTRAARERACTLALCLAPIKTAYEGMRFAEALGYAEGTPFVTAWALARALPRWAEASQ
jgi:hypothetical protein